LPGWADDRHDLALAALRRSCVRIASLGDDALLDPTLNQPVFGRARDWRGPCGEASAAADSRAFFERWFTPHAAANRTDRNGLFTGYYEPELRVSRRRDGRFAVPIYARPPDLVMVELGLFRADWRGQRTAGRVANGSLVPYASREQIVAGALAGRAPVIAWAEDPIDVFFMEIQGSGRLAFIDGGAIHVAYEAQNGHPYVAIGREFITRGILPREQVSMQSIRAWLAANPGPQAAEMMNRNPSYVFFRTLDGDGPVGAEGVALSPGRSLAVDRKFLPMSVPIWLDVDDPLDGSQRIRRLMVAQDTGGAIRGPVRGDVFWGAGAEAAERAGRMRSTGLYWLLLPKGVTPPA
jgi:membrane-bound lytic murein transglycosylase A